MSQKKCCVPGCIESGGSHHVLHIFPKPEKERERFNAWLMAIGGDILGLENDYIYRRRRVCHAHFEHKYWCRSHRISNIALPTLRMPDPLKISKSLFFINERRPLTLTQQSSECLPSTSRDPVLDVAMQADAKENIPTNTMGHSLKSEQLLMNSARTEDDVCMSEKVIPVPESEHEASSPDVPEPTLTDTSTTKITSEHNYYQRQKEINENNCEPILHYNKSDHQPQGSCLLLNQLEIARRKIKLLQSNLSKSRKRNAILKSKIKNANKMSEDFLLKKLSSKMTTAAKIFTKMQYTQTEKKPSGRRFTLEEKVLSLILYKKSPECYPLLEKFFTLPSAKSLRKLSTNVEMEPQLNNSSEQNS